MNVKELIEGLNRLAPPEYAMSWDNPGLIVGDAGKEVKKVYLALDATGQVIDKAADLGCDMIVTHHPMIFSAMKKVRADDFTGKRIIRLIKNDINLFAMHTNFDIAVMGKIVSDKIGASFEGPLEGVPGSFLTITEDSECSSGIGSIGRLDEEMTLDELARKIREEFNLPPVRYFGDPGSKVSLVAICPGAGKSDAQEAVNSGAQVYITGDVDHHFGIDCVEQGMAVIDAGHHGLEHIFVDYMYDWFCKNYPGLEVVKDSNNSPFQVV